MEKFVIRRDRLRERAAGLEPTSVDRSASHAAPESHPGQAKEAPSEQYEGQWLDEDGQTALGGGFPIESRSTQVEAFWPSGLIQHRELETGLTFSQDPPVKARFLRLNQAGAAPLVIPLRAARVSRMDKVDPIPFGSETARFIFPVFSERFESRETFEAAVRSLHKWILNIPPFNEPEVSEAFRLDAYFWVSPGPNGRFDTPDICYDCEHPPASAVTFSGDNVVAKELLEGLLLNGKYGLVLIDSSVRGGAGGVAERGFPAWVSITACPGEDWQAVALHEIGHGLGLADEYLDAGLATRAPGKEPNFSRSDRFDEASWEGQCSEQPPSQASFYSLERQRLIGRPGGSPVPDAEFVGLFQGARYRESFFRPSFRCLMRATDTKFFCPVCAESIRKRVSSHGG